MHFRSQALTRTALIAVSAKLLIGTSLAQPLPVAPMPAADTQARHQAMRWMHQRMMDPVRRTQNRLDRLGQDLHLKADQQASWDALREHLMLRAQVLAEQIKTRRAATALGYAGQSGASEQAQQAQPQQQLQQRPQDQHRDQALKLSPDQALEQRASRLREQAKQLEQTAGLVRALYEKLSPEQRTIMRLHRELGADRMRVWRGMRPAMPAMPGFAPERMKRGEIEIDQQLAFAELPHAGALMAMFETYQALDVDEPFDEALSLMP